MAFDYRVECFNVPREFVKVAGVQNFNVLQARLEAVFAEKRQLNHFSVLSLFHAFSHFFVPPWMYTVIRYLYLDYSYIIMSLVMLVNTFFDYFFIFFGDNHTAMRYNVDNK